MSNQQKEKLNIMLMIKQEVCRKNWTNTDYNSPNLVLD